MKIREILKLLRDDGWYLIVTEGSHRQFKHSEKLGRTTVSGHPNDDIHPKTLKSILNQAGLLKNREPTRMQYAMIIEKGDENYSGYFPDLPGCIATGKTLEELKQRMREALELHLRGMREDGLPIPQPSLVDYIEAA
jgi:predicted RNase H-like HicB family nuclease/predicted RNA binding protein YcfA (HicA-like mRNA interferase family)